MSLALVSTVLALFSAQAAVASSTRSLQQFAALPSFPYCRCNDYSSESSPYALSVTNSTGIIEGTQIGYGEFCFSIRFMGEKSDASTCYDSLSDSLQKFAISIQAACVPAFDVTDNYMTVAGVRKTSSWRTKDFSQGSILEMFSLKLTSANHGDQICIRVAAPCEYPEYLFESMPPILTISESSNHKCCPVLEGIMV